jgi:ABC-type nitrate/sulfonate/bicarbonate transport system substrate-binding protein
MTRRLRLPAAALAAGLALLTVAADTMAQAPAPATLVLPILSTRQLPAYIAEELGLWKAEGVDAKVSVVRGVAATNAVIAGNADFAFTGALAMQRAVAGGQALIAIAQMQNGLSHQIVLRADVAERLAAARGGDPLARGRALAGLTLAVDSLDGQPHGYLKYALARAGLDPDKGVTVTPVQPPSMLGAMQSRAVDGIVFSKPWTDQAVQRLNAAMWLNSETDAPEIQPFAAGVIVVKPETCTRRPAFCKGMVAGLAKAVDVIRNDRAAARAVLIKRFDRMEPAAIEEALDDALYSTGRTLAVSAEGMLNAQRFLVTSGLLPASGTVEVTRLFSNDYQP